MTDRFEKIREALSEFEASVKSDKDAIGAEIVKEAMAQASIQLNPYLQDGDTQAQTFFIEATTDYCMPREEWASSPQITLTKLITRASLGCVDGSWYRQLVGLQEELMHCLQYVNDIVFKASGMADKKEVYRNERSPDWRARAALYSETKMVARSLTDGSVFFDWPGIEAMAAKASTEFSRGVAGMLLAARRDTNSQQG